MILIIITIVLCFKEEEEKDKKLKEQRKYATTNFVKRVISHPAFHNVKYKDAEHMLEKFEQVIVFNFCFFSFFCIFIAISVKALMTLVLWLFNS